MFIFLSGVQLKGKMWGLFLTSLQNKGSIEENLLNYFSHYNTT